MNSYMDYSKAILHSAIEKKKLNVLKAFSNITHPDKPNLVIEQYNGKELRVFKHKGDVCILCPTEIGVMESEYLANAITSGAIFDDADTVENASTYVIKTGLPENTMIRQGLNPPVDVMMAPVGAAIGTVSGDTLDVDQTNIRNGYIAMKDMICCGKPECTHDLRDCLNNTIGIEDRMDTPKVFNDDIYETKIALKELEDFDDTDFEPEEDLVDYEVDVEEECGDGNCTTEPVVKQEGFLSKKPKKLKPIPMREIISYITVQKNAIHDTNDQAMLSGFTCAKLETCDFYISCLDTNDGRYIVPHDRASLVRYQSELNRLLTEILKLKPIDKQDRVWKVDVTYPEGWRG